MANYKIGVQKTPKGQFRVVLFSADNGKLVMQGEPMKNRKDAEDVITTIAVEWNSPVGTILRSCDKLIPASKKWPKNSGPAKTGRSGPKKKTVALHQSLIRSRNTKRAADLTKKAKG